MDGSTFGGVGSDKPGWRLYAGFDLPSGQMGRMILTPVAEGEGLQRIAVTTGELRIADRGFARPEGLRYMIDHGGDFLVRMGSRSFKLEDGNGVPACLRRIIDQRSNAALTRTDAASPAASM